VELDDATPIILRIAGGNIKKDRKEGAVYMAALL
jgi:hypothetical protein